MNEWIVIASATSVEAHFNRVLQALIDDSGVANHPLGDALLREQIEAIFRSWSSRLDWLKVGFNLSISGDPPIQDFLQLVEFRNAIVHGQGNLTAMQERNFAGLVALKQQLQRLFGVGFQGSRIIIKRDIQTQVIAIAREATLHLDEKVLKSYPNLSV